MTDSICAALTDLGSYTIRETKTVNSSNIYVYQKTGLVATRVDIVILSISGNVGMDEVILSSMSYSDSTANQYVRAKWGKGLFTISCASASGYFQSVDMHFMGTPSSCTIEYAVKITSPASVLEKRFIDSQKQAFSDYAIFHPYYEGIIDCYVERTAISAFAVKVVDKRGITSTSTISVTGDATSYEPNKLTDFGILYENTRNALFYLSIGESMRLRVQPRFDTAPTAVNDFPNCTVLTDRWFPSYSGLTTLATTESGTSLSLIDNKEGFDTTGKEIPFFYLFLKDLFPSSKTTLNTSFIQSRFQTYINSGHRRIGLSFCPTTQGSTQDANVATVGGNSVYYHFPAWMLTELNTYATYKPYIFDRIDTYSGATIKMYNLDWRDQYTRNLYKQLVLTVANYLKSSSSALYGKTLYSYIDVVKVAFAGTWGEGTTLDTAKSNYPTAAQLTEISDYITDELFFGKLCLRSLASALNGDFPEDYRNLILEPVNSNKLGVFYDGAGQEPNTYFYNPVNLYSGSSPEVMNKVFQYVKNHPCYVEVVVSDNLTKVPRYSSVGSFAKCFRPWYFNMYNIQTIKRLQSVLNLRQSIVQTSHYTGYRPYIVINNCELSGNITVKIKLSIGNYGTARFFHSYWKLRFYAQVCSSSGTVESEVTRDSAFDLSTIPAPFEPGVVNYYDTVLWSENWTLSSTIAAGKRFNLLVAIIDNEGICTQPVWFCNNEETLPRQYSGGSPTGKFYLIKNFQC